MNAAPARDAFVPIKLVIEVLKFGSSPNAAANSFNVSKVAGADDTIPAIAASTYPGVAIPVNVEPSPVYAPLNLVAVITPLVTTLVLLPIPIETFSHPVSCEVLIPVIPEPPPTKLPA